MAGSLELAKLVAATYLKQTWEITKGFNKWYLVTSVAILMLITSAGIFGYLSNAFQQQNLKLDQIAREISVYDTKIKQNDSEIARYTEQLKNLSQIRNSQESNISKIVDKNGSTVRLTQMVGNADKEMSQISQKIGTLTTETNKNYEQINKIKNDNISVEKEVGGFRFVADAFNTELKTVVKFFIFLIVFVFDPLAIALIIAFNGLLMRKGETLPKKHQVYGENAISESEEEIDIVDDEIELPNEALTQAANEYNEAVVPEKKKLKNPLKKLMGWLRN